MLSGRAEAALRCVRNVRAGGGRGGVCREPPSGGGSLQRASLKRGESAEILPQEGEADSLPKAKFRSHCSGGSLFLVSVLYSLVLVVHCLFVEKLYEPGYN